MVAVVVGAVEDEHRQVDPDLAGGEPDPVGGVHRRDHVGDQARSSSSYDVTGRALRCITSVPQRVTGRTVPPREAADVGGEVAWLGWSVVGLGHAANPMREPRVTRDTQPGVAPRVTHSYIWCHVFDTQPAETLKLPWSLLRAGGRHGLSDNETRDPIGLAVARPEQVRLQRPDRPPRHPQGQRADASTG